MIPVEESAEVLTMPNLWFMETLKQFLYGNQCLVTACKRIFWTYLHTYKYNAYIVLIVLTGTKVILRRKHAVNAAHIDLLTCDSMITTVIPQRILLWHNLFKSYRSPAISRKSSRPILKEVLLVYQESNLKTVLKSLRYRFVHVYA
jgi:hypothetical protein